MEKFPSKKTEFETYYSNLCSTVLVQYTNSIVAAHLPNVSLINHHIPIRTSDREYTNKVLFRENDHSTRCWMSLDFCHAGRASEVSRCTELNVKCTKCINYTTCSVHNVSNIHFVLYIMYNIHILYYSICILLLIVILFSAWPFPGVSSALIMIH